ncbi:aspartic peptidase domain-containing protein [Xylariales sp. AK1849]|nr:aspartic peptidase domain-containing protein [Xylariales sp. AK1849]
MFCLGPIIKPAPKSVVSTSTLNFPSIIQDSRSVTKSAQGSSIFSRLTPSVETVKIFSTTNLNTADKRRRVRDSKACEGQPEGLVASGDTEQNFCPLFLTPETSLINLESATGYLDRRVINHTLQLLQAVVGPERLQIVDSSLPAEKQLNNTSYSGYYFNGAVGYSPVTLAGITVPKQEFGLIDLVAADVDGEFDGIVGFAFSTLTSSYPGTNASNNARRVDGGPNVTSNRIEYSNLMNTLFFEDNLTEPVFSLAISRDESGSGFGGMLSIGVVPDGDDKRVNTSAEAEWASTPMEIAEVQILDPERPQYQFYVISAGLAYGDVHETNTTQYIVDSGTPLNYVPDSEAVAANALFDPPGSLDPAAGFLVQCNATAPAFGAVIAGQTFWTNPSDMFAPNAALPAGMCQSAIQPGGAPGHYILGESFLENVLAVFDVGQLKIGFKARVEYES